MLVASGNRRNVYEDHPHIKHDSAPAASPTGGRLGDPAMAMPGARTSRSKIQRARYLGSSSLISSRLLIAALDERSYNGLAIPGTRGFHRNADRSRCLPGRLPVTDGAARHFRQQLGEDGQGRVLLGGRTYPPAPLRSSPRARQRRPEHTWATRRGTSQAAPRRGLGRSRGSEGLMVQVQPGEPPAAPSGGLARRLVQQPRQPLRSTEPVALGD
jgi:hypothetical protein